MFGPNLRNKPSGLHIVVNAGLVIIPRLEAKLVDIDLSGNGLVRSGTMPVVVSQDIISSRKQT